METLRVVARSMLIDVLSCRRGMSNSGVVSRIAGDSIGADGFLPNMGSEDFLLCLSRQALEAAANDANVTPRLKVRETRSELVSHFAEERFVHASALFAPDPADIIALKKHGEAFDEAEAEAEKESSSSGADLDGAGDPGSDHADDVDATEAGIDESDLDEDESAYGIAAE